MKRNNSVAVLLIILATTIYSCSSKNGADASATPQQVIEQLNNTSRANDTMRTTIDAYKLQVDQLKTQIATLDTTVNERETRIAKLTKEVSRYKKNSKKYAAELKKAKKELNILKEENRNYLARIDVLESNERVVTKQRDSVVQQYFSLKELASVLTISNIHLETLNLKHHGKKEKKTVKARKTKIMRVIFDINENRIAESGTKKLYIIIKGPDGNVLTNNMGSGQLTDNNGQSMQYSVEKDVNLKKLEPLKAVTTDWRQNDGVAYKKGAYEITIYNGGYEVGKGKVYLN